MNGEAPLKKELIKNSHYIVLMLLHVCCVQNAEAATALPPPCIAILVARSMKSWILFLVAGLVPLFMLGNPLPLLAHLAKLLGTGDTPQKIQAQAAATCSVCAVPEPIQELAELGNVSQTSESKKNVERDLGRWIDKQPWRAIMPTMFKFKVWGRRSKGRLKGMGCTKLDVQVLCPHLLVGSVFRYSPQLFEHLFIPPGDELDKFWEFEERGSEWFHNILPYIAGTPKL